MACAPTIPSGVSCFQCYGMDLAKAYTLYYLAQWLVKLDSSADVTPAGLITYATCFFPFLANDLFEAMQLALLRQIVAATS
jgi:hypothetical protein